MGPSPVVAGYSTREVARMLGVSEHQVRSFVDAGFLTPRRGSRGEYRYSFEDLVVLRTAQGLLASEIPPRRVRTALERLREQLPRGRSLAAVRIAAEGGEVVVRAGSETWEPVSGQRVLDFEVSELVAKVAPLARGTVAAASRRRLDADDWYELAYELEATSPEEAEEAYRRALELVPEHTDAHLNLGRLLHETGRVAAAEACYRRAAELAPKDPTAAFNLGVALQDLGRHPEAVDAYRQAVELDPGYADAHFNLAVSLEQLGEPAVALKHLKIYRSLIGERG